MAQPQGVDMSKLSPAEKEAMMQQVFCANGHVVLVGAENWELLTLRRDEQEAHLTRQLHFQRPASPGE